MKKILFITNRNALTTCGALRLIKNRAESLFNDYGIISDFIVFQKKSRVDSPSREEILAGGEMKIIGYQAQTYFKGLKELHSLIQDQLNLCKYNAIIISQIALLLDINNIRSLSNAPIYLDIHGAPNDIYGSVKLRSFHKYIYRRLVSLYYIYCLNRYFKRVDGCLVVSKGLESYLQNRFTPRAEFCFFRAPCALASELSMDVYHNYRKEYRKLFELNDDELAFVYSGGLEPWQCIEETIGLYRVIREHVPCKTKMLIFSYEVEKAKSLVGDDNDFVLKSYKADELEKALCACDYAFLLRKNITTNHVAFPNKFLEYVKSYLKIVATPYVYDVAEQISEYNLGMITDFNADVKPLVDFISNEKQHKCAPETIKKVLEVNSFKERLKDFSSIIS